MAIFHLKTNTQLKKITLREYSRTIAIIIFVVIILLIITVFNFINRGNHALTYPALGISLLLLVGYKKYLQSQDIKLSRLIKGIKGEQTVESVLTQLPEGYTVYNDIVLDTHNGNIDFVVVGTNGVFTVEVKNMDGEITFDGNRLLRNGKPIEKDYLYQANKEYEAVHNYLLSHGLNIFITPLLVFNRFAKVRFGTHKVNNVTIIGLSWLNKTIIGLRSSGYINTDPVNQALKKLQTINT